MSWRDRAALVLESGVGSELTKPTKPPITEVSSVLAVPTPAPSGEIKAAAARRQRVLAMLADHPEARYAVLTDMHADPQAVIVALAIRGRTNCELRIPRAKYDGTLLLDLIERHGGTVQ